MEKINLNFEKSCNQQITQLHVKAEDIVSLYPHKDCQITVEFKEDNPTVSKIPCESNINK